jgi:hypothetical protein
MAFRLMGVLSSSNLKGVDSGAPARFALHLFGSALALPLFARGSVAAFTFLAMSTSEQEGSNQTFGAKQLSNAIR